MYSWFLKRRKRGQLEKLQVQDPRVTNALLMKKQIDNNNLATYTPKEIADLIEADAIISGDYETDKPMSEGASVAHGPFIGVLGKYKHSTYKYECL